MSQPMPLNLNKFESLFRDSSAFHEFVDVLKESLGFDLRPIFADGMIIGATLSVEGTKEMLTDRLVRRMTQNPSILSELAKRVEHDAIVD